MLAELYMLQTYFEDCPAVLAEDELVCRYGAQAVREAVADGLIERRQVPCAKGVPRWFCRLSESGCLHAQKTGGTH